jgi:putative membrane protein
VDVKTSEAAAIVRTANQGEVEQANAALNRLKSDGARDFARQMITEHGESQQKLERLMTSNRIQMQETDETRELKAASDRAIRAVENADESDTDRAYINAQINGHEELLKKLDDDLIPNTPDSELKQFLEDLRPVVAMHLEHARRVKTDLMLQGASSEGTPNQGQTAPTPGAKGQPAPGSRGTGTPGSQGTTSPGTGMHGGPTPEQGTGSQGKAPTTPAAATRSPAGSQNQGSGTQGSGSQSSGTQGSQTGGAGR